jgi:hypothetical protein
VFNPTSPLVLPSGEGSRREFVDGVGNCVASLTGVISHGDETRGGSGSKVNMEAILRVKNGRLGGCIPYGMRWTGKYPTCHVAYCRVSSVRKRDNDRELVCKKCVRNNCDNKGSMVTGVERKR